MAVIKITIESLNRFNGYFYRIRSFCYVYNDIKIICCQIVKRKEMSMAITSTKYRIMLVVSNKDQFGSLYKYLTITDTDGTVKPYETDSLAELDAKVESMLNGEYKKNDFIIVKAFDYDVLADIDTAEEVSG
jgi:hypothetical protein